MIQIDIKARQLRAAEICRSRGITQAEIASALGASQSQVSRILAGKGSSNSRLSRDVLNYVEAGNNATVTLDQVRENEDLMQALQEVWDGTQAHAQALAVVIKSLVALSR